MRRSKISKTIEKIEIWVEDVVIAILAIMSILFVIAALITTVGNKELAAVPLYQKITMLGYGILPWLVMLALLSIARDVWIIRKLQEKNKKD